MLTMFVKPMPGLIVRHPVTRLPLAAEGEEKPRNSYWLRRIREKSVTEETPPEAAAPKEPAAPAQKQTKAAAATPNSKEVPTK
jgi:hypothetical protein